MYAPTKYGNDGSIYLGNYHLTLIHLVRCLMDRKIWYPTEVSNQGWHSNISLNYWNNLNLRYFGHFPNNYTLTYIHTVYCGY